MQCKNSATTMSKSVKQSEYCYTSKVYICIIEETSDVLNATSSSIKGTVTSDVLNATSRIKGTPGGKVGKEDKKNE